MESMSARSRSSNRSICSSLSKAREAMKPALVHLRSATSLDAAAIVRIHHRAIHTTAAPFYSPQIIEVWASPLTDAAVERAGLELTETADRIFVVAEIDSQVAGFGIVVPSRSELRAVYVDPDFGRRGVGA